MRTKLKLSGMVQVYSIIADEFRYYIPYISGGKLQGILIGISTNGRWE